MDGKGDKATAEGNDLLRKELDKLKEELATSEDGKSMQAFFTECIYCV